MDSPGNIPTMKMPSSALSTKSGSKIIEEDLPERPKKKKSSSKGIRFAETLDIAPEPSSDLTPKQIEISDHPSQAPISESIVERSVNPKASDNAPTNRPKVSRFKAAKLAQSSNQPAEPSLKDEFAMYKKRMEEPQNQVDHSLFYPTVKEPTDENVPPPKKLSKFKAARLGISQGDTEDL